MDRLPQLRQPINITVLDLKEVQDQAYRLLEEACEVNGEPKGEAASSCQPEVRAMDALFGAATVARYYHGRGSFYHSVSAVRRDPYLAELYNEVLHWQRVAMYSSEDSEET